MGTAGKFLDLLDSFTRLRVQMGLSALSRLSGLDKATCHPLRTELESRGVVGQVPTGVAARWQRLK